MDDRYDDILHTPIYEEANAKHIDDPWEEYIPEDVNSTVFFSEVAEIYPKYMEEHRPKVKFRIVVPQGKEGIVPHLQMYFRKKTDADEKSISYICLHKAEYSCQYDNGKRLSKSEKKALIEFLNTFRKGAWISDKKGNPIPCNCWQECVDVWIATHGDNSNLFKRDENGIAIMPDYSALKIRRQCCGK